MFKLRYGLGTDDWALGNIASILTELTFNGLSNVDTKWHCSHASVILRAHRPSLARTYPDSRLFPGSELFSNEEHAFLPNLKITNLKPLNFCKRVLLDPDTAKDKW